MTVEGHFIEGLLTSGNVYSISPIVAPNHANRHSNIAKTIGLGTHRKGKKKAA